MAYMLPGLLVTLLMGASSHPAPLPTLTPPQAQYLADVRAAAEVASKKAENELLKRFRSPNFKLGLMLNGGTRAWKLATTPVAELLTQLKDALANVEYVHNFGLDPAARKSHPGSPAMDFSVLEEYGHIPNMWELKARNAPQVNGTSLTQWQIMESAERDLWKLPINSRPLPVGPNSTEALERPLYIGGNLRSIDVGLPRYGSYSAVLRNDVVRERAPIIAADSGAWENACNSSLTPVHYWPFYSLYDCDAMAKNVKDHATKGTADHQLHTILTNAQYYAKVGGSSGAKWLGDGANYLSRLVYQLLVPKATATPFETILYTEAALLGPMRPQDMKMIVANFAAVYGTPDALRLQDYCVKHRIPLVWGLSGGENWMIHPPNLAPNAPSSVDVAADRILDPISVPATNASLQQNSLMKAVFDAVHKEVAKHRASEETSKLQAADFKDWWKKLSSFGTPIQTMRPGDCASADLCFGTYRSSEGAKDCMCRHDAASEQKVVALGAVESSTPADESAKPDVVGVVMV